MARWVFWRARAPGQHALLGTEKGIARAAMETRLSLCDAGDLSLCYPTPANAVSTVLRARYGHVGPSDCQFPRSILSLFSRRLFDMRDDAAAALGQPVAKRLQSAGDLYE